MSYAFELQRDGDRRTQRGLLRGRVGRRAGGLAGEHTSGVSAPLAAPENFIAHRASPFHGADTSPVTLPPSSHHSNTHTCWLFPHSIPGEVYFLLPSFLLDLTFFIRNGTKPLEEKRVGGEGTPHVILICGRRASCM